MNLRTEIIFDKMTKTIKVLRKPLSVPMSDRPKAFPPMPILYLELLENKKKVNPNLVNKEFVPKKSVEVISENNPSSSFPKDSQKKSFHSSFGKRNSIIELVDDKPDSKPSQEDTTFDTFKQDKYETKSTHTSYRNKSISVDPIENRLKKLLHDSDNENDPKKSRDFMGNMNSSIKKTRSSIVNKPNVAIDEIEEKRESSNDSERRDGLPPKLSELPSIDSAPVTNSNLKNINLRDVSDTKEQDKLKSELMFKFDILRKKYKEAVIPEFTQWSDYETMLRTYENTIKRVSLDSAVDNYKKYLIAGFVLMEFVTGKFISDASGFAQQQIVSISSYDKLLIELGEKSHVHAPSKIPVELRLLGLVIFNMFLFIIMKIIFKKTGLTTFMPGSANNINNVNTKKRKMKGPSVNLN